MTRTSDVFVALLHEGGEWLSKGDAQKALEVLEKAQQIQADDTHCLNLLGLACFKLNLFEQASDVYVRLVAQSPNDATLRVNLGLTYLKLQDLVRARREFEAALRLDSTHAKAHNYLALTFAYVADYGRAREHFLMAGAEDMALRMEEILKEQDPSIQEATTSDVEDVVLTFEEPVSELIELTEVKPHGSSPSAEPFALDEKVSSTRLEGGTGQCKVSVAGEVFTRMDGWLAQKGQISAVPLSHHPFFRLEGQGTVYFAARGRTFEVMTLSAAKTVFNEGAVRAVGGGVKFEMTRLSGAGAGEDLKVFNLWGPGEVMLEFEGILRMMDVHPDSPVVFPLTHFLGFEGDIHSTLLTQGVPAIQLKGTGFALFAAPALATP